MAVRSAFLGAIALCLAVLAHGQILSPPEGNRFTYAPKFDPGFIAENGIREVRAEMETKRDGDRIRKTHRKVVYQFDEKGQNALIATVHAKLRDTVITAYQFVGKRIECEIKNDAAGMFSYCYTYNEEGQPLERKYARVKPWRNKVKTDFTAEETRINSEKYTHAKYENQLHTTLHNSAGRPYQKEIRYYDDHGYLVRYMRSFVMTSDRHEEVYTYEAHGWLSSMEVTFGRNPHRLEFTYDGVGNLLTEERFEQGQMVYHKEFVYEGENMFLRAELIRRESEGMLEITTYTYSLK